MKHSSEHKMDMLTAMGAGDFGHINGSLLQHLIGTRDLLKSWGGSEILQDAGLYHAAYSTAGFRQQLVNVTQRSRIAAIIGDQAENIVYHYCACDRESFYSRLRHTSQPDFTDRFTAECKTLQQPLLRDFCHLTVANEIDIAATNPAFLRKHGASRYAIYSAMFPNLNADARAAVQQVFAATPKL